MADEDCIPHSGDVTSETIAGRLCMDGWGRREGKGQQCEE